RHDNAGPRGGVRPDGPDGFRQRPHRDGERGQHHRAYGERSGRMTMGNRVLGAGLACAAFMLAAPAAAQGQPAPEATVDIGAIPGVVSGDDQWRTFWAGPMIVDGMTAAEDGGLLFAQEQSNSIIKVWPDGKWWVQWPYVAGAGAVSVD